MKIPLVTSLPLKEPLGVISAPPTRPAVPQPPQQIPSLHDQDITPLRTPQRLISQCLDLSRVATVGALEVFGLTQTLPLAFHPSQQVGIMGTLAGVFGSVLLFSDLYHKGMTVLQKMFAISLGLSGFTQMRQIFANRSQKTVRDYFSRAQLKEKSGELHWQDLLRDHRVILIGERHPLDNAHYTDLMEHLPELKEAGLTHIAIEQNSSAYLYAAPFFSMHHAELMWMAKMMGIKVIFVDEYLSSASKEGQVNVRNEIISHNILKHLEGSPEYKIIALHGATHMANIMDLDVTPLQTILQGHGVQTFSLLALSANKFEQGYYYPGVNTIREMGYERRRFIMPVLREDAEVDAVVNIPEADWLPLWMRCALHFKMWYRAFEKGLRSQA